MDTLNHEDKLNAEVKEDYRAHDTEIRTQYVNQISELTNENHELQAQLASWYAELKPYFTSGNMVEVERALIPKTLFDSLPAPAKPLSTKKMDMVWDLIKDVEDEGGRNE